MPLLPTTLPKELLFILQNTAQYCLFYCPSSGQPLSVLENSLAQAVSIPGVGSEDWAHSQKRAGPYKGLSVSGAEVGTVLLGGPTLVHTSCTAQLSLFSTYSVPDPVF